MALHRFGFIVTGSDLDPARHRTSLDSGSFAAVMVGVASVDQAPAVAREMVADGIELIELCGGFGPQGTAAVIDAIKGAVPVGSVGYGPESLDGMAALFPPG